MTVQIKAKVAGILNSRELVLNRGTKDGVELGMRFAVLTSSIPVTDPETEKELDPVTGVKTIVKIVRLDGSHTAVGRTFRTIKGRPGLSEQITWGALSQFSGTSDRPETFSYDRDDQLKYDQKVAVGDVALQVEADEYAD